MRGTAVTKARTFAEEEVQSLGIAPGHTLLNIAYVIMIRAQITGNPREDREALQR
jgi:hypothetical protein